MRPTPLRLRELLERLTQAEVRFVLVGGLAVNAWGHVRGTKDVDVVPDPSSDNLALLESVLRDLGGKVEVGERHLDSAAISTFLRAGDRTYVATDLGHVDILQGLPQIPSFAVLDAAAKEVDLDGLRVRVCSLDHLREMKRSSDRARDRDDLEALEGAQTGEQEKD